MESEPTTSSQRVLVVYARAHWTRPVASALGDLLAHEGFSVELADADATDAPSPGDYDAVVIGSPHRLGRRARSILEYVSRHRDALSAMPAFWFSVGHDRAIRLERMLRVTGWLPERSFTIVRPGWRVRWFGDPDAKRARYVRELALAIGEQMTDRRHLATRRVIG